MVYDEDDDNAHPFLPPLPPGPTVLDITHKQIMKEYFEYTGKVHVPHLAETVVGVVAGIFGAALLAACIVIGVCWRRRKVSRDRAAFNNREKRVSIDRSSSEGEEGGERRGLLWGAKRFENRKKRWYDFRRKGRKMVPSHGDRGRQPSPRDREMLHRERSFHERRPFLRRIFHRKRSVSLDERGGRRQPSPQLPPPQEGRNRSPLSPLVSQEGRSRAW